MLKTWIIEKSYYSKSQNENSGKLSDFNLKNISYLERHLGGKDQLVTFK